MSRFSAGVMIALLLGGCAGGSAQPSSPASSPASSVAGSAEPGATAAAATDSGPPELTEVCQSSEARRLGEATTLWLEAVDGVRLFAVEVGTGPVGIVLAHQGMSNLCGWIAFVPTLVEAGYRVLAFDFRANGRSEYPSDPVDRLELDRDLEAAIARIRDDGATNVILLGASMGGAAAVQNGAALDVDGIISMSGTHLWPGFGINHPDSLPELKVPFLMVVSREDPAAPLAEAQDIVAAIGSTDKTLIALDGSAHGWSLVEVGVTAPAVAEKVLTWIRSHVEST
jgi:alpha-beta hydrolase superfamily lysophospholipase